MEGAKEGRRTAKPSGRPDVPDPTLIIKDKQRLLFRSAANSAFVPRMSSASAYSLLSSINQSEYLLEMIELVLCAAITALPDPRQLGRLKETRRDQRLPYDTTRDIRLLSLLKARLLLSQE